MKTIAVLVVVLGIFSITGGIFALRRKTWRIVMAGSISSILICWYIGIPALILAVLFKKLFQESPYTTKVL
ncbi:hypothetical protein ACFLYX_01500 [Chloroflexota bacterium]